MTDESKGMDFLPEIPDAAEEAVDLITIPKPQKLPGIDGSTDSAGSGLMAAQVGDQAEGPAPVASQPDGALRAPESRTARDTNQTLYQIVDDYANLVDQIVDASGEMTEDLVLAWDRIRGEMEGKLDRCGEMLRLFQSRRVEAGSESKRLGERDKAFKSRHDGLREYILHQMIRADKRKVETDRFTFTVIDKAPSCEVYDETAVPADFCSYKLKVPGHIWHVLLPILQGLLGPQGGEWQAEKVVVKDAVIDAWKQCAGAEQTPGTEVTQGKTLRFS